MSVTHAIAEALTTFTVENNHVGAIPDHVMAKLATAIEDFKLSPDALIDVKRLPANVDTFDALVTYLKTVKEKIGNRPADKSNKEWEVAQRGELKLYKLYVCAIHAVHGYLNQEPAPDLNRDISVVAGEAFTYGSTNPPAGLADNGTKLWKATFTAPGIRTHSCVRLVLYMLQDDNTAAPIAPVPAAEGQEPDGGNAQEEEGEQNDDNNGAGQGNFQDAIDGQTAADANDQAQA